MDFTFFPSVIDNEVAIIHNILDSWLYISCFYIDFRLLNLRPWQACQSRINYLGAAIYKLKMSSSILKGETAFMKQLQKWLAGKCKWNLCYRASRDGWDTQDFHGHCDNKGPTVVLVKANDCIFGGYTDKHWDSST